MQTFKCPCGNTLFFSSRRCVRCDRAVGRCPQCSNVTSMVEQNGLSTCGHCDAQVGKCRNYQRHDACNGLVRLHGSSADALCAYCQLNGVIPDLKIDGNLDKWRRLEAAKHGVLFMLDLLDFPFQATEPVIAPLRFEFKADGKETVATGHQDGCITINIKESDSVERERTRVDLGEPQRTLVGHFRHELGHYMWDRLVKGQCEFDFRTLFGDERSPTYGEALTRYYENGPKPDWRDSHISAYATMHPWEDFAETFGAYLDMATVINTANHFNIINQDLRDLDSMVASYQRVGLIANELNRDMGLLDLVPEVFVPPVIEKMRFVHQLRDAFNSDGA